jgi:hypothetical protein
MHGNRKISSTPSSADKGRSAKAINRNADVYVPEKSHCAVVPVNQPNNEGQPSAEAGEGRAQKIDWLIFTAGYIAERTGHNLQGESIYRRPMDGNALWASRLWRTKSFSRLW